MKLPSLLPLLALSDLLTLSLASSRSSRVPKRPSLHPSPYHVGQSMPHSPSRSRSRYCYVDTTSGKDDTGRILKAFEKCNDGGTVVLDETYLIASPLDLTFLKHVDVVITGTVNFKDDVYYWADHSFKFPFQNQSVFWKFGGKDINIYGDLTNDQSVLDGHGEAYWKELLTNSSVSSPVSWLLRVVGY